MATDFTPNIFPTSLPLSTSVSPLIIPSLPWRLPQIIPPQSFPTCLLLITPIYPTLNILFAPDDVKSYKRNFPYLPTLTASLYLSVVILPSTEDIKFYCQRFNSSTLPIISSWHPKFAFHPYTFPECSPPQHPSLVLCLITHRNSPPPRPNSPLPPELSTHPHRQLHHLKEKKRRKNRFI